MTQIYRLLIVLAIFSVIPAITFAETVVRTGESVSITNDQTVENDFYAAASTVSVSGEIKGDMYVVGASMTTNGPVGSDLGFVGGVAQIHNEVKDDVRVIAGETVVAGHVGGDIFVVGGILKVLSSASVDGDIYFYGGEAEISAPIKGSVMGSAETIRIDSVIEGGVNVVVAKSLILGDKANIAKDISYQSPEDLTRSPQAIVAGQVIKNTSAVKVDTNSNTFLVSLFVLLFTLLSIFIFFKDGLQTLIDDIFVLPARAGLIGLGAVFVAPLVAALLMVTVLGLLVGLSMFLTLLVLYSVAMALVILVIGSLLMRLYSKTYKVDLTAIAVGTLGVTALLFIPAVGGVLLFTAFLLTLGGLVYQAYVVLFVK
jgi:hypothetical protein